MLFAGGAHRDDAIFRVAITEAASRKVLVRVTVVPPSCTLTGLGLFSIPLLGVDFLPVAVCTPVPVLLAALICCTTVSLEPEAISCRSRAECP